MTGLLIRKVMEHPNAANRWPTVRMMIGVVMTFCCALPLVWLLSNLFVYGVRTTLGH
jgi:hypothetical protein